MNIHGRLALVNNFFIVGLFELSRAIVASRNAMEVPRRSALYVWFGRVAFGLVLCPRRGCGYFHLYIDQGR
jgi:hypothetical protein